MLAVMESQAARGGFVLTHPLTGRELCLIFIIAEVAAMMDLPPTIRLDAGSIERSDLLRLAGEGMASGDIAGELGLSDGTVRNYLSEAISKLGASNRVEAARLARTKGWL